MKRPTESDFEINVMGAGVEAIFKPTKSHYSYNRLVDEKDIARFGSISPARVRHAGPTGDTPDYDSADVEAMALRLASAAVRRRWYFNAIIASAPRPLAPYAVTTPR